MYCIEEQCSHRRSQQLQDVEVAKRAITSSNGFQELLDLTRHFWMVLTSSDANEEDDEYDERTNDRRDGSADCRAEQGGVRTTPTHYIDVGSDKAIAIVEDSFRVGDLGTCRRVNNGEREGQDLAPAQPVATRDRLGDQG